MPISRCVNFVINCKLIFYFLEVSANGTSSSLNRLAQVREPILIVMDCPLVINKIIQTSIAQITKGDP